MENKWTHVSGFQYAGQWFSVWAIPIRKKDGTFEILTKAEETTPEEIEADSGGHGFKYAFSKESKNE